MSEVASLELCKELYELSGWTDTHFRWADHGEDSFVGVFVDKPIYPPAYSLGYLLRKLPAFSSVYFDSVDRYNGWYAGNGLGRSRIIMTADTPEDAACKLAI